MKAASNLDGPAVRVRAARVPVLSVRAVGIGIVLLVLAFVVDGWAYEHIVYERVYDEDWGRLLRVMGFLGTWLLAGAALVLVDWPKRTAAVRPALRRGGLLVLSAAGSGIAGEVLKLVFRRERPRAEWVLYSFRPFTERPLHNGGLALPSTHAVVAFGAAVMLTKLFPRAWPIWWLLAIGCGLTRVMARAHYVSDIVGAALVAVLVGGWIWRRAAPARGQAGA